MADEESKSSGGIEEDQSNLDDAQAGKNTALRTRAQASNLAANQRNAAPANQMMLARTPGGKQTRAERWYDKTAAI